MTAREDRAAARATEICDECCARPGDPCVSLHPGVRGSLMPISGVHGARLAAYRASKAKHGHASEPMTEEA